MVVEEQQRDCRGRLGVNAEIDALSAHAGAERHRPARTGNYTRACSHSVRSASTCCFSGSLNTSW
jgi:hypothetical protein